MSKYKPTKAEPRETIKFRKLLDEALKLEGKLSDCYSAFHNYSFGNQILAMMQIGAEPINTFMGWQALGRKVKKGAHAIELCMPITCKKETEDGEEPEIFTRYIYKRNWFGLSQTEGKPYSMPEQIAFDKTRVLNTLAIAEVPFNMTNGNVQGYTNGEELAINPVAKYPLKTLWHELGHAVLGHAVANETAVLERSLKEVEAESVAYIMCNIFGYDKPKEESRGYIQNWLDNDELPESSAKRIFQAVSDILRANN